MGLRGEIVYELIVTFCQKFKDRSFRSYYNFTVKCKCIRVRM